MCPKDWKKKQVRFEVGEGLGHDPTLSAELTTLLAGCMAEEQEDTTCPSTVLSVDPPQQPPFKDPNASDTKDFWTLRQEKTLALAQALQCCTERSGALTRVICNIEREIQKCMAPLTSLNGDDIVEASLLEPAGEECKTSPMPEEEAAILDEEPKLLEAPEAAESLPECLDISGPAESAEQINAPTTPAPLSDMSKPDCHPFQKAKNPQRETEADPSLTTECIWSYVEKREGTWLVGGILVYSLLQGWVLHWQPNQKTSLLATVAFRLPSAQLEKSSW